MSTDAKPKRKLKRSTSFRKPVKKSVMKNSDTMEEFDVKMGCIRLVADPNHSARFSLPPSLSPGFHVAEGTHYSTVFCKREEAYQNSDFEVNAKWGGDVKSSKVTWTGSQIGIELPNEALNSFRPPKDLCMNESDPKQKRLSEHGKFVIEDIWNKGGWGAAGGHVCDVWTGDPTYRADGDTRFPPSNTYANWNVQPIVYDLRILSAKVVSCESKPLMVAHKIFTNNTPWPNTAKGSVTASVTTVVSSGWDTKSTIGGKFGIKNSVQVPGFSSEMSAEVNYSEQWGTSGGKSTTTSKTTSDEVSINLPAGSAVDVSLIMSKGVLKVEVVYEASIRGNFATRYSPKSNGHYLWFLGACFLPKTKARYTNTLSVSYFTDSHTETRKIPMPKLSLGLGMLTLGEEDEEYYEEYDEEVDEEDDEGERV